MSSRHPSGLCSFGSVCFRQGAGLSLSRVTVRQQRDSQRQPLPRISYINIAKNISSFALFSESCTPVANSLNNLGNVGSLPVFGPASLQLAHVKTQLALHQLSVIAAAGNAAVPSPALTLFNLLKVTMSHPLYNSRGAAFSGGQRTGQFGLSTQPNLALSGSRVDPGSLSSQGAGLIAPLMSQQVGFPLSQPRPAPMSQDLESSIDLHIRGAREEVQRLTQIMQQSKQADPRLRKDSRDGVLSPASSFSGQRVSGRVEEPSGDWPRYPSSSKPFSSQGMGLSTSSSTLFPTSGYGSPPRSGRSSERLPPLSASAERRPLRYTSESASSILANFGLTSEDLELLSLYPDEELTPDNLPFILRDIRMRKGKRIPERDDRLAPDPQHGKVIDYGHSSKFGYSEERSESFSRDHLPKDTLKYAREVAASGSPFGMLDSPKLCPPSSTGPIAKKPTPMDIRSSAGLANIHVPKVSSPLLPLPILPAVALPVLGFGPRPALMKMGAVGAALQPAIRPSGFHASNPAGVKRLPTPTMMNDYSAATPRIFPHTCSLCNVECAQIKDWIEHQNTNLHIERCRLLRKQYPDWNADSLAVARNVETSASLSVERRSPKRRSKSWSRSPSPSRNHASTARRKRSRSRSPRRFRRSRSHSHSRSPRRKSRSSPALHRRRSRSPPRHSRSPQRRSPQRRSPLRRPRLPQRRSHSPHRRSPHRRSPQRRSPQRRSPPRRSRSRSHGRHSPPHFNRRTSPRKSSPHRASSSSELLAKKLIESSAALNIKDTSSLEAMVQSLAPALLAELAKKKRNIESSKDESSKDGTSERSASPASKQRSSSKAASTKAASTKAVFASTKAASTKAVFASTKAASMKPAPSATKPAPSATKPAPATTKSSSLSSTTKWKKKVPSMNSGMLKLKGLPIGTPYQDIVEAIKPFGKCTNVIVLKKTNEAYVRIEKEQDSIALLNCKDLTVNGNKITVSLKETGEETHVEQKDQTDCKSAATKKESSPSAISKASHNKADPEKAPIKAAPVVKKVLRKEIPWRKNIVEIAGLPESGVSEEELASLARPHGFNTVPVIAMTLKKAYLELPDTHAAEAMVKAFSESPAKINDTILTVSKMSMPMDLSYTESLFRVLMGIEKTSEIVTLPERLVTIGNVPNSDSALTEILEIIKSIGAHKRFLLLNNRVIFEMESPDITQNVHAHFLKCPCTVQEKVLTATLARIPKAAKEAKRKKDVDANTSSQKPGKAEDKDSVDSGSVAHNLSKTDIATPEEAVAGGGGPTSVENVVSPASATLDIAMASPTREECATAELGSARALDVDMQEPDLPNEGVAEKSAASAEKGASQTEDETATSVPLPESSTETQQDLVDFAPVEDGFNGGKPEEMKTELEEDFTANRKADCGVTSCSELTETKNDFTEDPDQASTTNSEADVQPRNQQQTNKTASKPEGEQATGETDPDNPITKPDPSQDFLPVSQEMLKALEAAVHQCRMQSSLRQKQKQAEAQSNITATKDSKTNQSDLDKTTPEGDNEQPRLSSERSSSRSRRRGRAGSEDNRPASAPRDVSGSTPSVSQKSRKESSPVTSKSRERKDEGKRKSRSSSRISASSKSDSRAREEELVESEDFPFNLDEFVTVDEVGDEVEEVPVPKSFKDPQKPAEKKSAQKRSAPVARGKRAKKSPPQTRTYRTRSGMTKEVEAVKDEAANTAENQMEADVCEPADVPSHSEQEADELKTEVSTCTSVPLDEQEKAMDETMATDTETKAELQSALPTPSATLAPSTVTSEPSPADRAQDEIVAPGPVKEDCVSEERTPSAKVEEMQSAGSESLEESEKLPEPQTTTGITEPTSGRGEEEALGSHLQTQNVLVTLDEVCEEEDNYPEEVDEEELLKMQAGEYPEALFTVDEIGEDEVEEKDIHALVTLDEIVEEEDEEQKNLEITSETLPDNKEEEDERVDSFNPEALVTLDEANDDEMEQEGGTKNSKPVDNTTKAFDQSAEAPPSPDLDEFPQINFVTVDEVGEEDTQEEVRKAPPEELKEEEEEEEEVAVSTRKRTKGRRKARQTAAKRRAAAKAKEISEQESDKSPAMTSTTTELAPAAAESPIAHATLPTEEPEKEEPQLRQKEEEKDVDDQMQGDSEGTSETRAATKEAAKERREAETSEETKAKRSRSRSPVRMDFTMPPFSPNNPIGIDFVVPKMGYFCKLCSLFYSSEETAKKSHCSSMRHYQNVQKYYEKMRSEQGGS